MIDTWVGAGAQLLDDIEVVDSRLALLVKPLCDVGFLSLMRTQDLLIGLYNCLLRCFHCALLFLSPLSIVFRRDRGSCWTSASQILLLLLLLVNMMWAWRWQLLGLLLWLGALRRFTAITIHVYSRLRFLAGRPQTGCMPRSSLFRFEWIRCHSIRAILLLKFKLWGIAFELLGRDALQLQSWRMFVLRLLLLHPTFL